MDKKKCSKCGEEKELSEFHKAKQNKDGYRGSCKDCVKEYKKEYRKNNKEYNKEYCKEYYENNKEKRKEYYKEWFKNNKEYRKEYYKNNKEKVKEYKSKNKEKINKRIRERKQSEPLFKMKSNLRARTSRAFKVKSCKKNTSTEKMLGCNFETAHKHIERQFTKGMNWNNQGEWHIDHIIPLASAKTEEELIKLCHYTNLQPLWAKDNRSKGSKMPNTQTKLRI